jgi:hypothetical protein
MVSYLEKASLARVCMILQATPLLLARPIAFKVFPQDQQIRICTTSLEESAKLEADSGFLNRILCTYKHNACMFCDT